MARIRERALAEVVLQVLPPPDSLPYQLNVQQARITLSGPEAQMAALAQEEVQLLVDLSQLMTGQHDSLKVETRIPPWCSLVRVEPAIVGATIGSPPAPEASAAAAPRRRR